MQVISWQDNLLLILKLHTVIILGIGTPYLLTIFVLKFEIVYSTTSSCV